MKFGVIAGASALLALGIADVAQACCLGPPPMAASVTDTDPAPLSIRDLHGAQELFERNVNQAINQGRINAFDARPALQALDDIRQEEARRAAAVGGVLNDADITDLFNQVAGLYVRVWVRRGYF